MMQPRTPSPDRTLPLWRRALFATIIPNVVFYTCLYLYFTSKSFEHVVRQSRLANVPQFGILALIFSISAFFSFVTIPTTLLTTMAAFRPWLRWYTALLGGFGRLVLVAAGLFTASQLIIHFSK
jgi:hypothetical protein